MVWYYKIWNVSRTRIIHAQWNVMWDRFESQCKMLRIHIYEYMAVNIELFFGFMHKLTEYESNWMSISPQSEFVSVCLFHLVYERRKKKWVYIVSSASRLVARKPSESTGWCQHPPILYFNLLISSNAHRVYDQW